MKSPRLTSAATGLLAFLLSASLGWAQDSSKLQRSVEGILNDAHKNESKEVVLECAYVLRWESCLYHSIHVARLAKAQGLDIFVACDDKRNMIPVVVQLGGGNDFIKRFGGVDKFFANYEIRTRKLRGVLTPWNEPQQSKYRYYLRYGGAKKWVDSEGERASEEGETSPQKEVVAFNEAPLTSFATTVGGLLRREW